MLVKPIVGGQVGLVVYSTRYALQRGMLRRGMRNTKNVDGVAPHNRYYCRLVISKQSSLDTVVHECLHVAAWLMRRSKIIPNLGRKYGEKEEVFAYYQNWVLQEVLQYITPKPEKQTYFLKHKDILSFAKRSFKKS